MKKIVKGMTQDEANRLLPIAAREGYTELVTEAILAEANVNAVGMDGLVPLHLAAAFGNRDVAAVLLSNGASVDAKTTDEEDKPLHFAAAGGHRDVIVELLKSGAGVDEKNKAGYTAMHYAATNGHTQVLSTLLEQGAAIDAKDQKEWTPLALARFFSQVDAIRLLEERGATSNQPVNLTEKTNSNARSGPRAMVRVNKFSKNPTDKDFSGPQSR